MTDQQLKNVLTQINLNDCQEVVPGHIYYTKRTVRSRMPRKDGTYWYDKTNHEFLVIANNNIKQGIILRWGTCDLHWLVLKKYRNQHVLSNALRTGIINKMWPENQEITCDYDWCGHEDDDYDTKYAKTEHFAQLANLKLVN